MSHRIPGSLLVAALAVKLNLVLAVLSYSEANGVYKLECQNVGFCLPLLEVKSISNDTGHYLTSLRFNGKEQCELPAQLAKVGGAAVSDGIGLRSAPIFPELVCGATITGISYLLEIFIRRAESTHSVAYPSYACPRPVRHVKGRRYVVIRNQGNRHYCVYNELRGTVIRTTLPRLTRVSNGTGRLETVDGNSNQFNRTIVGTFPPSAGASDEPTTVPPPRRVSREPTPLPPSTRASDEPKTHTPPTRVPDEPTKSTPSASASNEPERPTNHGEDDTSLRNTLIIVFGGIAAAIIGSVVAWHLNSRGLCCWNAKPDEKNAPEEHDIGDGIEDAGTPEHRNTAGENNANREHSSESDNGGTPNVNGNGGQQPSVTNGDFLQAQGRHTVQVTGNRYNFHNHNHYNFNAPSKATD